MQPGHILDKHFVYLQLVKATYSLRDQPGMLDLCEKYCREQIDLFPSYKDTLERNLGVLS